MDTNKELLIKLFRENVKGKIPDVTGRNIRHDGRKGNWLEEQFGKSQMLITIQIFLDMN